MAQTVMYSIADKNGTKEVVRHVLPWGVHEGQNKDQMELHKKALAKYINRGYTTEKPVLSSPESADKLVCPVCGKEVKSEFGLRSHMKTHK